MKSRIVLGVILSGLVFTSCKSGEEKQTEDTNKPMQKTTSNHSTNSPPISKGKSESYKAQLKGQTFKISRAFLKANIFGDLTLSLIEDEDELSDFPKKSVEIEIKDKTIQELEQQELTGEGSDFLTPLTVKLRKESESLPQSINSMSNYSYIIRFGQSSDVGIDIDIDLQFKSNPDSYVKGPLFAAYYDLYLKGREVDTSKPTFGLLDYLAVKHLQAKNPSSTIELVKSSETKIQHGPNGHGTSKFKYKLDKGSVQSIQLDFLNKPDGWSVKE